MIGILIAKALMFPLTYPWDFLQAEKPKGYADYKLMKQTYHHYKDKFGKIPDSLNFLPREFVEKINTPDSPFTYSQSNGELWYRPSSPFSRDKRNLMDCILGKNKADVAGALIGKTEPQNATIFPSETQTKE